MDMECVITITNAPKRLTSDDGSFGPMGFEERLVNALYDASQSVLRDFRINSRLNGETKVIVTGLRPSE